MNCIKFRMSVCTLLRNIAMLVIILSGSTKTDAQEWDQEYYPFVEEGKVWNCGSISPKTATIEAIDCIGQESYEPFLKEGKTWKYNHHDMRGTQYMYSLIVKGDTTINELAYKKIYDVSTDAYQYALREDGKKVFCQFQNSDTPKLLYDFGKNAGEIVSEEIDQDVKIVIMVISVDTVKSGDRLLRRMKVVENYSESDEIYESNYSTWIEGLGSSCGLDTPVRYPGNYNNFYSCWIGDDILGESDIFSATGIDTSVNDTFKTMDGRSISPDAPIYDLQGRRLSATPQKGVYIQNGKKKLVK